MNEDQMIKYPRTPHISGSRVQAGDEDLDSIPFESIAGRHLVIEEKVDGSNTGISFDDDGKLLLQSRGHFLNGGYGEKHYDLMKQWAVSHRPVLFEILKTRYIMYGEWLYAKHTLFYDALPHYFLEFDIYDKENGVFLDTAARRKMLEGSPVISVPVLGEGKYSDKEEVLSLLGRSNFVTGDPEKSLTEAALASGLDPVRVIAETELSSMMEGLYIKVEENGMTVGRMKYVRSGFTLSVNDSDTHWVKRHIVQNRLSVPLETLFY